MVQFSNLAELATRDELDLMNPVATYLPVLPVDAPAIGHGFREYVRAAHEQPGTSRLFDQLLEAIPHGSVVLEMGAGHGVRTIELAQRDYHVIAAEPADEPRNRLIQAVKDAGIPVQMPEAGAAWQPLPKRPSVTVLGTAIENTVLPEGVEVALRLDRHDFYHHRRELWVETMRRAARELSHHYYSRYWLTLKARSSSDNDMLEHLGFERFHLDNAIAEAFAGDCEFRYEKRTTRCDVKPDDLAHAVTVAWFMLSDAACLGLLTTMDGWAEQARRRCRVKWEDFLRHVEDNLSPSSGRVWQHNHDHFFIRREPFSLLSTQVTA